MRQFDELKERNVRESFKSTLLLLLFGLGALSFLVAADHPQWFSLRPASGVSAALSHATHKHDANRASAKIERARADHAAAPKDKDAM